MSALRTRIVLAVTTAVVLASTSAVHDAAAKPTKPKAKPPAVASVSTHAVSTAGGTRITVHGARFARGARVVFGTTAGRVTSVTSSRALTVIVPRHRAGSVHLRVIVGRLTSPAVRADIIRFVPPPAVGSLSTRTGPTAGTTAVTVRGTNLAGADRVLFGTTPARITARASAGNALTVRAPAHAPGPVHVRVRTAYGTSPVVAADRFTYVGPPTVTTSVLPTATRGLRYLATASAGGGTGGYTWTATGLPDGLAITPDGTISGTPTTSSASTVTLVVTDALRQSATRTLTIAPSDVTVPESCVSADCALFEADGSTVQIPATRIGNVVRDDDGVIASVLLTGQAPSVGQILVLAPTEQVPSGVIVTVTAVTSNDDGTTTVQVGPAGPADAYNTGTVKSSGSVTQGSETDPAAQRRAAAPRHTASSKHATTAPRTTSAPRGVRSAQAARGALSCDGSVQTDLSGLDVTPSLTPTVTALWKHPFFGGGGIYVGTGGLSLFQFDLDGSITVDLGVSISGAATCSLSLPTFRSAIPAGALGAVLLSLAPSVTFTVTGKVDIRTRITLTCGAEYRWNDGHESRVSYCRPSLTPLQVSADSGVDATLTGALDASITLNDVAGITGNLTAAVHAGYHPTQRPRGVVDAKVTYDLGACLACFWNDSPARVSLVSGTVFNRTIATFDLPGAVPASGPPAITTSALPDAGIGRPYSTRLTTADNRNGTWSLTGDVPSGLGLSGDRITGKAEVPGSYAVVVGFEDTRGRVVQRSFTLLVTSAGGGGTSALDGSDYCRSAILDANDDESTDALDLPFPMRFGQNTYTSLYVNNNGYVTFDGPSSTFTPYAMADAPGPIIAPFFADVDTRDPRSSLVTYGVSPDGHSLCVNWVGVGYFSEHADKTNSFQLIVSDRSAQQPGDFDVTFNYGHVQWETGEASDGTGGIGGRSAVVGYSDGDGRTLELPGSGVSGDLLDGGPNSLTGHSSGSSVPGRYYYVIRS